MKTAGKIIDATVIVGSAFTAYTGGVMLIGGIKNKKVSVGFAGAMALLISVYAFKEAVKKINE